MELISGTLGRRVGTEVVNYIGPKNSLGDGLDRRDSAGPGCFDREIPF
jgi:hypothetical protein